jgi:RNA polymerase sigma factor (sigma-70 family)
MTPPHADRALGEVQHLFAEHALANWPDCRLLDRFIHNRDEAAFAALLERHGPTVLRVCRSVLRDAHDAEDAFQATFLVLACAATKVRNQASIGSFLHGTAYRVAVKARARLLRRRTVEKEAAAMHTTAIASGANEHECEAALHEELSRLPERLRRVVVRCHLEGQTHAQAAAELGCPAGSVSRHLCRAVELLRERLAARGLLAPAALLGGAAAARAAVPAALAQATLKVIGQYVAGSALVGGSSVPAVALAKEALKSMSVLKLKALLVVLLLAGLAASSAALFARPAAAPAERSAALAPGGAPGEKDEPVRGFDRFGDLLPANALARLGTVRLRQGSQVKALAFTRDGQELVSLGNDSSLQLWQVPSGKEVGRLPGAAEAGRIIYAVAFSDDGKTMATADDDKGKDTYKITFFDCNPGRPGEQRPPTLGRDRFHFKAAEGIAYFLAFLPDGNLLGGSSDGRVFLWDLDGKEVRHFGAAGPVEHAFAIAADGKRLAITDRGTDRGADVTVWDVAKGVELNKLTGHQNVSSMAFAPDGKTLAVGDGTNTIRLWDVAAPKVTARLVGKKAADQTRGVDDAVTGLAFTPDGKTLLSVGDYGDGTVRVWDVEGGKESRQFKGQLGDGHRLLLSPDGKTLAVTGMNATIRLFDLATGKPLDAALGSQGAVYAVAVAPDGKQAATAGSDGVVRLYDRATGQELRSFRAHGPQAFGLAFSPDGKHLVTSGAYEPAKLWDLGELKEVRPVAGALGSVRGVSHLALSPDGKKVVLTTNEPAVQLVDVATGKVEQTLAKALIDQVAFSPDGKRLLGGGFDRTLHVWDLATGKEFWSAANANAIASVAYTPDGKQVMAGTYGGHIHVFDAANGQEVRTIQHQGVVRALAVSPDGRLLAAGADAPVVFLYELATGELVQRFNGHTSNVWSLAFAPDGRSLVSGSFDATALVWDLTGKELAAKQREPLSDDELDARWTALGNAQAEEAYQAVLSLANAPKQTVPFLRKQLGQSDPADAKAVAKSLAELDDDKFDVRQKASQALGRLGKAVEADLRRERDTTQSPEVKHRLDELLDKLSGGAGGVKSDERLRSRRLVAVLELAATPETKELLEHLAKKGASEELRQHAKGALERLAR